MSSSASSSLLFWEGEGVDAELEERIGEAVPTSWSDITHSLGTGSPEVRKKRVGEAKGSNAPEGAGNNLSLSEYNVVASHTPSLLPSSRPNADEGEDDVVDGGDDGGGEVATPVQSYTPFLAIKPAILVGSLFEAKDSVSAREVARVAPR